eukprot:jgi/Bigna1/144006/aug1.83_g18714
MKSSRFVAACAATIATAAAIILLRFVGNRRRIDGSVRRAIKSAGTSSGRRGAHWQKDVVIVKLGGAAITCKNKFETVDEKSMQTAIDLLASHHKRGIKMAKKYKISEGVAAHAESLLGASLCRRSVKLLNQELLARLTSAGVPAMTVSPFPTTVGCTGAGVGAFVIEEEGSLAAVEKILAAGYVPLVHGDVILDSKLGHTILSGDTIIEAMCARLHPRRAVFITDVRGVFSRPPSDPKAKLIHAVRIERESGRMFFHPDLGEEIKTEAAEHDVTGGIQAKLASAARIVRAEGTTIFIGNVSSKTTSDAIGGTAIPEEGLSIKDKHSIDNELSVGGTWLLGK